MGSIFADASLSLWSDFSERWLCQAPE